MARTPTKRTCSVEGCGRPVSSNSLCSTHDRRRKLGQPLDALIRPKKGGGTKACSQADCDNPAIAKGLCHLHYGRLRRGVSLSGGRVRVQLWEYGK